MGWWRLVAGGAVIGLGVLLSAASAPPVTVYFALGDSVAAGAGASRPELSYVGRELAQLQEQDTKGGVRLALYAVGGATSEGLRRWQTPAAVDELAALRRGERPGLHLGPLTITVGGNDLLRLLGQAAFTGNQPDASAVRETIRHVEASLDASVATLLAAAGPAGRITLTTYYDPFRGRPSGGPTAALGIDAVGELNQAILRVAERYPTRVRVARVDQALPADASIARYLADPIHPNDRGHALIAAAVGRAWEATGP